MCYLLLSFSTYCREKRKKQQQKQSIDRSIDRSNERTNERTNERMNKQTNKQTDIMIHKSLPYSHTNPVVPLPVSEQL
jgi:hypothetical protein